MDDSDQDFVDLCSKLLKRVRKKPGEPRQSTRAENQPSSQPSEGDGRRKRYKKDGVPGTQPARAGAERGTVCGSEDAGSLSAPAASGPRAERGFAAKDKVLQRMQQFKRASPQRMVHTGQNQPQTSCVPPPQVQAQGELT